MRAGLVHFLAKGGRVWARSACRMERLVVSRQGPAPPPAQQPVVSGPGPRCRRLAQCRARPPPRCLARARAASSQTCKHAGAAGQKRVARVSRACLLYGRHLGRTHPGRCEWTRPGQLAARMATKCTRNAGPCLQKAGSWGGRNSSSAAGSASRLWVLTRASGVRRSRSAG